MGVNNMKVSGLMAGVAMVSMIFAGAAQADMKEMKKYKEAIPGATVKCIDCHTDAMPKKDDGKHELNEYGKAVMTEAKVEAEAAKAAEAAEVEPTVETYKKVGAIADFKK